MRVSGLTSHAAPYAPSRSAYGNGSKGNGDWDAWRQCVFLDDEVDEHTHLITPTVRPSYAGNQYAHDLHQDDGERERWWREQLMDEVFGKWPVRLLNRRVSLSVHSHVSQLFMVFQWWWWHLETILCYLCYSDDDE